MNSHDLGIFVTTARVGSITKAAATLSTVQSNVTARIKTLEDEVGSKLFHRNHRGISLTPKGLELLPYAQQVVDLIQKAKEKVSDSKVVSGMIRIGSLHSTASVRLPELLKIYLKKYKTVDLAVETGTAAELTEKVIDHRLDGAFVVGPVHHTELRAIPVFEEELVIVMPKAYRTFDEFLEHGPIPKVLVFKVGCTYRRMLDRYFAKDGVNLLTHMEFGTLDGILGCVSAGLGVAMMPKAVAQRSSVYRDLRLLPLPGIEGRVVTEFIFRGSEVLSSAMERFLEVINTYDGNRGPETISKARTWQSTLRVQKAKKTTKVLSLS